MMSYDDTHILIKFYNSSYNTNQIYTYILISSNGYKQ